jgi:RNA polymerase sigma-70 factor (ECF subfamily)
MTVPARRNVTPPDSELVVRIVASNDRAAFGELVRRHQATVRSFLRHLSGGDATLADDLAQETFIQAYRALPRFRGEAAFSTWLLGIAHNQWRNARRRQRTHLPLEAPEAANAATPSPTRTTDLRQDLATALRRLSQEEQTAVHLCYQQGLSHSEIAAVLDWPLGTVKTHLARSKEKLRQLLAVWNPQN